METEYAWLAGFWDGEGNVSVTYVGPRPRVVVQVAQVNREPLDRVKKILGKGSVLGPYKARGTNHSDYYVWRVEGGPHLEEIKEKIYQYLCSPKQDQFDRALNALEEWSSRTKCLRGHKKFTKDSRGRRYCADCRSESGAESARARWWSRRSGDL